MKNEQILALVVIIFFLGFVLFLLMPKKQSGKQTSQQKSSSSSSRAAQRTATAVPNQSMQIDEEKTYTAVLKTDKGDITVELNAKQTPVTVNNFVTLSRKGFYDNTVFHRTVKDFMIQGGDPKGDGTGGPGYRFDDEPFEGEYTRGTVAMANAGPDTNGSQFFIMHKDVPLPKDYVIFGKVTEGLDVVDTIAEAPVKEPQSPMDEASKPVKPVVVKTVEIVEE